MNPAFEQWIGDTVDKVGWVVISVAPRADCDEPKEWWSYSVGLPKTFAWPELICFGLSKEARQFIINDAVEECRRKRVEPSAGLRLTEVLNGLDVLLAYGAGIPDHYFGWGNWFAQKVGVSAPVERLQVLWPDNEGRFPGEQGCAEAIVAEQTPLGWKNRWQV